MATSHQHKQLVALGVRWVKQQGFAVVASEINAGGSREVADVIGFRSSCSVLVEAKASRRDFLADRLKPERRGTCRGLGLYRFYLAPPGVIGVADLPPGWGLLHAQDARVIDVFRALGNMWPGPGSELQGWAGFQHQVDEAAERGVLFSIARRLTEAQSRRPDRQQLTPQSLP
ncbi:hypothetical protein [Azohydromonas lata]|uniref:Holliday junction resolvase n=1 Tax=Azohydromonas lata TaxID=45677 RepID=A0ABU5IK38_9BURK|nr:hypothetical protein [Azohydromonas lata]MDZ5459251.1 hypothetical protein [Azohydromonas lata]